jgi:hypothetical protein
MLIGAHRNLGDMVELGFWDRGVLIGRIRGVLAALDLNRGEANFRFLPL